MSARAPWQAILVGFALLALSSGAPAADANRSAFVDPLDAPAAVVPGGAQTKPMLAVVRAGARLVAAGMRGVIVHSDDGGARWSQAATPVQSDLSALTFVDERQGWAVGHDGVILATADGGKTWQRQLDGRMAGAQFAAHYRARQQAGQPGADKLLREIERNYERGPVLPFLDVVFDDARRGFVVGTFGMIAATEDGGKTWTPWLERADNPELLSFYAARRIGTEVYLAGERGMVYRLDRGKGTFVRMATGYAGSLFGIVGNERVLLAFGLRGTVVISTDGGASWSIKSLPVPAGVTGATLLDDGRVVLTNVAGMLWIGDAHGAEFRPLPSDYRAPATALQVVAPDRIVVAGLRGLAVQRVTPNARP